MKEITCGCCGQRFEFRRVKFHLGQEAINYMSLYSVRAEEALSNFQKDATDSAFQYLKARATDNLNSSGAMIVDPERDFVEQGGACGNRLNGVNIFEWVSGERHPRLQFTWAFRRRFCGGADLSRAEEHISMLCPYCYCVLPEHQFEPDYLALNVGIIAPKGTTKSVTELMIYEEGLLNRIGGTYSGANQLKALNPVVSEKISNPLQQRHDEFVKAGLLPEQTAEHWKLAIPFTMTYGKRAVTLFCDDFAGETINALDGLIAKGIGDQEQFYVRDRLKELDTYCIMVDSKEILNICGLEEPMTGNSSTGQVINSLLSVINSDQEVRRDAKRRRNCLFVISKADLLRSGQEGAPGKIDLDIESQRYNNAMSVIEPFWDLVFPNPPEGKRGARQAEYREAPFDAQLHTALQPVLREWVRQFIPDFVKLEAAFRQVDVVVTAALGVNLSRYVEDERDLKGAMETYWKTARGREAAPWNGMNTRDLREFLNPIRPDIFSPALYGARFRPPVEYGSFDLSTEVIQPGSQAQEGGADSAAGHSGNALSGLWNNPIYI